MINVKYPKKWADAELFDKTISKFVIQEKFILINDLNERSISHKLAEHLKDSFTAFDVDCEYNRMELRGTTNSEYASKRLHLNPQETRTDSLKGDTVFPDIIIHKRGYNRGNYVVVEIKKKKYADEKDKDGKKYRDSDREKLCAYTKELKYKWGIYLEFDRDDVVLVEFYKNGEKWEEA